MRYHLWIASAAVSTACFLSNAVPSHADEREEIKARIAQLREESEELSKNGKHEQARQRKREAAELMRKNQADMEKFREELMAKSRKEADELKADAVRTIAEQRVKAVAEVKAEAVNLAILIAEKLLGEKLDENRQRALAEQFVNQLPAQTKAVQPTA